MSKEQKKLDDMAQTLLKLAQGGVRDLTLHGDNGLKIFVKLIVDGEYPCEKCDDPTDVCEMHGEQ